ncbi:MAG: hypothetical protein U9N85_01300 [Bacteroidota bacterium]|nr:hypothetical protein [Bacteroidota bacterium]
MKKGLKTIPIVLAVLLFLFSGKTFSQKINAGLQSVNYYTKSADCLSSKQILVRIKYKTSYKDKKHLQMTHEFTSGVKISSSVTKIDKSGYIVYDFCMNIGEQKESFKTIFRNEKGESSDLIHIHINLNVADIKDGTPEKIYNL